MERRAFGNTDMSVSILGFGGAEIGEADQRTVDRLLHSAMDAGLNMIDTAECYGNSEELIGKALAGRRDDCYLFTKCGHASGMDYPDWDPVLLARSIDRSLKRLKVDYVDVVHLHSCSEEILRRGEVIEVLQRAKEQGKTRYIGYSGDSTSARYAVETGVFDSFETSVNIADQEAIELTIPLAVKQGMGIIAKRPIANVAWKHERLSEDDYAYPYWLRLQELNYDFLNDVQQGVEIAMKFTLSTPGVATAIVGTGNPDRWHQNAQLLRDGMLPQETYQAIRSRWKEVAGSDWVGKV
ncbi:MULTISPECIES: aldo/keto reductase [Paenibacillus]|uniref:Aldo/keto reductase n=2 Tax=Paenibacillus lactis TaxID=228574 RepID=G4HFV7_9BACL|nr:aldo/keto reductase [Paenibacillus lactis]EHB64624.1 aldo/keto reductase [Paenibacillus lactis 154]MBP1892678.1 aryl-alcohol dehydrogenase-like predicted oxidoreductase [Paenibacillus lactis]MCM3494994.1 aldo/keto reductase [Paenibacillus lactis]GIO91622.1 aldo/keto reductase [Paenibacillus lactis]HAF97337.1 aldo/keto reductase [Paenibacillus lactis]